MAMSGLKISDFENGSYSVGKVIGAVSATYEKGVTEPPRRYTQSDLIDDMMAAHKFATTEQDRSVLKQISGLGTSRTREPTISGLLTRGFIDQKRSHGRMELIPTSHARTIIENMPAMLTSVAMTAKWEMAFRLIEEGKATPGDVEKHLNVALQAIVDDAKSKGTIAIAATAPSGAHRAPSGAGKGSKAAGFFGKSK
jgi:DNA topoisomerase IA